MIRLLNAHFPARTLLLGISEACLVMIAFVAATITRMGAAEAFAIFHYQQGPLKIFIVSATFATCMYYFDFYDFPAVSNRREFITRLIQVLGTVCIMLSIIYYVFPRLELGRGIFVIGFVLVAVLILLWRRLALSIGTQPQFAEKALLFGDGPLAGPLRHELESRPELGIRIVSHVVFSRNGNGNGNGHGHGSGAQLIEDDMSSLAVVADELSDAVKVHRVSRIVVAMGDRRGKLPVELLLGMKGHGVAIQDGNDVYEAVTGKVPVDSLRLGWLLFSPGFHVSRFLLVYKRLASMCVSLIGLGFSLPLIPFVALAIKLTSPGPVFYKQKRVGHDGRIFDCYKFRTMRADAEADTGPTWAGDDDPRITYVGKLLRISRIDEIPQLWNVLKGDMCLVGPRPERPEFVGWLSQKIPFYQLRHTIRPGITGWAQIRYKYGNSIEDTKEKLCYDLFYIKNISPGLDLLIFLRTIKTILWGRGAK